MITIQTNVKINSDLIRLNNDVNGNPRYYIENISILILPENLQSCIDLPLYRGKKYGKGYVITSYSLEYELDLVVQHAFHTWMRFYIEQTMDSEFERFLNEGLKTHYKTAKGYFKNHILSVKSYQIKTRGIDYACEDFLRGLGLSIEYSDYNIEKLGFLDPDQYWTLASQTFKSILKL